MPELLRQKVYQSIKEDVTYGKLFPGQRLVEAQLAERFHASRSPIREAIRQLQSEGLIRLDERKGITVARLSTKEVDEIFNLRWLLESYAARLSADQATPTQVAYLRSLQAKLKIAGKKADLEAWIHNNILFHDFFSENSGNDNLHKILVNLKHRVYLYHYIIVRVPGHFETYIDQHEEILKACKKGDGETAEKYMKAHIESIRRVLVDQLDKFRIF